LFRLFATTFLKKSGKATVRKGTISTISFLRLLKTTDQVQGLLGRGQIIYHNLNTFKKNPMLQVVHVLPLYVSRLINVSFHKLKPE
jgi:hypothetical protein